MNNEERTRINYWNSERLLPSSTLIEYSCQCPYHGGNGIAIINYNNEVIELIKDIIMDEFGIQVWGAIPQIVKQYREFILNGEDEDIEIEIKDLVTSFRTLLKTLSAGKKAILDKARIVEILKIFNDAFVNSDEGISLEYSNVAKLIKEYYPFHPEMSGTEEAVARLNGLIQNKKFDINFPDHLSLLRIAFPIPSWL